MGEIEPQDLPVVHLDSGFDLAVLPEILEKLGLKPGQEVDSKTTLRILNETRKLIQSAN